MLCAPLAAQTMPAKVAIIIDDIGYQKTDPTLIQLPYALTFAVMPFAPHGKEMALLASQHRKEVMLHMPMEAVALNHLLGKGALRRGMDKQQVQQNMRAALDNVPQAVGVNNHMGSLFTSLPTQMDWAMQVIAERNLYFVDSKTTAKSVAAAVSQQYQVKHRSRDIFLDNNKSYAALEGQFNDLMSIAKQHGSAVGIGHPYPETLRYLQKNLPRLKAAGIDLVPLSELLHLPQHDSQPLRVSSSKAPSGKPSAIAKPVTVTSSTDSHGAAEQQLAAEEVVTPVELLPWRIPYRVESPGLVAPSAAEPMPNPIHKFDVPTQEPLALSTGPRMLLR